MRRFKNSELLVELSEVCQVWGTLGHSDASAWKRGTSEKIQVMQLFAEIP